jgi:hypothetical protein
MLGWLVYEHGIEPHATVFDKSARQDGAFSRDDFTYDHDGDVYYCPGGKILTTTGSRINDGATLRYRVSKYDCEACRLKPRCCPKEPARYVPRSKAPEIWHAKSHDRGRGASRDGCVRRSRCYLRTSKEFSSSTGSDYEDRMVRTTSSSSRHRPEPSQNGKADTGTKPQASIRVGRLQRLTGVFTLRVPLPPKN